MNFKMILNCKRKARLEVTTTNVTTIVTAAMISWMVTICPCSVRCSVKFLISFHPQRNPIRCRIIAAHKRKVRITIKSFSQSIYENETYLLVNLKNKIASYFTSKMSLLRNSRGTAVWDMKAILNQRQVQRHKSKVSFY